jgi:hypothetical protein
VLKKIKNESDRRFRLHIEQRADADAAEVLCKSLCKTPNDKCIQGFIRRIAQKPFGMLMLSDIQVSFITEYLFEIKKQRNFLII